MRIYYTREENKRFLMCLRKIYFVNFTSMNRINEKLLPDWGKNIKIIPELVLVEMMRIYYTREENKTFCCDFLNFCQFYFN